MKPAALFVALAVACSAALAIAAHTQRNNPVPLRWSEPRTWPNGRVPRVGDSVSLPEGRTILLDVDPPPLKSILISGEHTTLRFEDTADRRLTAGQIVVSGAGAKLVVGQPSQPFRHRALIRLVGSGTDTPMLSVYGKSARLEMHGTPGRTSWTRLAQTAEAGADTLALAGAPKKWHSGDTLVVAPTGYDPKEAETVSIASVSGATVHLSEPLRFRHWGTVTARGIDERAEVGLLSRNITVEGEEGRGGCVMIMGAGAGAGLSGAEFRHLGVLGEKGKYPVHFHRVGNGTGSFVRDCAIHHGYNRWLTIHGTRHVVAKNNVGFETVGHGYFLEDGDETDNTLENNLGIGVRSPAPGKAVTPGDVRPAVFWVSNPDNSLRGNVAAGSDYYGFWYDLPVHPTGAAETQFPTAATNTPLRPRRTPLGIFDGNTAHTCDHDGLFVDNAANPPGVTGAPTYDPTEPAFFHAFSAYKCRRRGVWVRGSRLFVTGARLADNGIGVTLAASASAIKDSLIVGETENRTGLYKPDEPGSPLTGFEFYDGPLHVENTTFADFVSAPRRPASALGVLRFSPFFVAPVNEVRGLRFENAERFYWERRPTTGNPDMSGDGYRTAIFVDGDGSVTGSAGARVVAGEPFLYRGTDACRWNPDWKAATCDGEKTRFARVFVDNRDKEPGEIGPVRLSPRTRPRDFVRAWGVPRDGANNSFQANVRVGAEYVVRYEGAAPPPAHVRVSLRDAARAGDPVSVTLPVGDPKIPISVYAVDARRQRTAVIIGGEIAQRDARTGDVTLHLVTPEVGKVVSIEIVRGLSGATVPAVATARK